jgi:putative holliday junction resolvase
MPGRVLALDPGSTRIGVAISDPLQIVATPLTVLPVEELDTALRELVDTYRPVTVVVGHPVGLSGREGPAADAARAFADHVRELTGLPVELIDERFTTVTAEAAMVEGGVRRRDRRQKVDKVAAAVILRQYLDRYDARSDEPPKAT